MTYIEFFDRVASENVSACLTYAPDRVIYIGDNAKLMRKHIESYSRVFSERGYNIDFSYRTVTKSKLDDAVELLSKIVEVYDDCVFDVTGGDGMLSLALGIVYSRHPDRNIQIHRFNLRNNAIYDYDKDGNTIYRDPPKLSIRENVRIYGGDVIFGGSRTGIGTYEWNLSEDFIDDVNALWNICKRNVRLWNLQTRFFGEMGAIGRTCDNGLTVIVTKDQMDDFLRREKSGCEKNDGIIRKLIDRELLTCYEENNGIKMSYKNSQVKKCLNKAGQVLEMKIFITARGLADSDGTPVYNDALNGVVIDWDGDFNDDELKDPFDTENEIDVLLMHDVVPVFISCKNGSVGADELYKLNTVAERFGGRYSKKVLVATAVESLGIAGEYLRQRAKDMNIRLVENVHKLDDAGLEKKLRNLWNG